MGWADKLVSKAPGPKLRFYSFEEEQQIMAEAQAWYKSSDLVAPTWEQLGDTTKDVWCSNVKKRPHWQ